MSQHLLERMKIRAVFQQVRREAVPQGVGGDVLADLRRLLVMLNDLPEALAGHTFAVDIDKEGQTAKALLSTGCVIIGQHADSTGAPAEVEAENKAGKICYSVGYNIDMLDTAPTAALTSATNNWKVYYKYAFEAALNGEEIATDWSAGYEKDAVAITKLGTSCAEGTQAYVDDVIAKLKDGSLKVFDTSKFTVEGKPVTSAPIDLSYCDFTTNPPTVIYQ